MISPNHLLTMVVVFTFVSTGKSVQTTKNVGVIVQNKMVRYTALCVVVYQCISYIPSLKQDQ